MWPTSGRSPRVRGSPAARIYPHCAQGSIPAGAGKPHQAAVHIKVTGVDPRGCGEAMSPTKKSRPRVGRSPRVRGSLQPRIPIHWPHGSIPAGAGKPAYGGRGSGKTRVDPRGCGEAKSDAFALWVVQGRSPRVRGSLDDVLQALVLDGSIPAGAGKPTSPHSARSAIRVDPRGCGEAAAIDWNSQPVQGRSPRVRGSHQQEARPVPRVGSIPAGAGKPCGCTSACGNTWVDPRGCGEARRPGDDLAGGAGRSPRVRGSLLCRHLDAIGLGSIPAGAGKPHGGFNDRADQGVDPRGCGEAAATRPSSMCFTGRSPRVRGSHTQRPQHRG
ncbi:MAG: hypothetical protein AWU55_1646 [Halomonadaceae bacterium T82-2]|nr:MAG: hypothetical protein AWU55_1646 [Halomonadaceae bacterium T82-2]